ncbi:hypothetical protein [Clostridium tetani]|uniref:hypothetical protein n=1 Tax=Clostridium tetani TaxID=1513 RepID=UPI0024A9AEB5|nr:hypothetical protein [Clostridium tetani]
MKYKNKYYLFIIFGVLIILFIDYKFTFNDIPSSMPSLKVRFDNGTFYATPNGYNWSSSKNSSSNLGYYSIEIAKEIKAIKVPQNGNLKLILSSDKGLKIFNVKQIIGTTIDNHTLKDINLNDNIIITPENNGEYIYYVYADWGDNHFVEYIIKIVVED